MAYSIEDRMRYYDYWIKFLNHLKIIIKNKDYFEIETDIDKIVGLLNFDYCEDCETDTIHRIWCYNWKSTLYEILMLLMKVLRAQQFGSYNYKDIMEDWEYLIEKTNEDIDVNLMILRGELKGAEQE